MSSNPATVEQDASIMRAVVQLINSGTINGIADSNKRQQFYYEVSLITELPSSLCQVRCSENSRKGLWTHVEDDCLQALLGIKNSTNKWCDIAAFVPGRVGE